jgi:peptide-methionine (S)-S-oxide reductase
MAIRATTWQSWFRFRPATAALLALAGLAAWYRADANAAEGGSANAAIWPLPKAAVELPAAKPGETRTAVLAGGCFWCEEGVFEQLKGVTKVVAGYAGGTAETANYDDYHDSNHAESVQITYDPAVITYGELIRVLFSAGDPTVKDGQEPDYGHGYRMAIFYATDDEKKVAEAYIAQLTAAKAYKAPIVATVEPMPHGFFPAEAYHQHFVTEHPDHPYVCRWSLHKIQRVRATFADEVVPLPGAAVPAASAPASAPAPTP